MGKEERGRMLEWERRGEEVSMGRRWEKGSEGGGEGRKWVGKGWGRWENEKEKRERGRG